MQKPREAHTKLRRSISDTRWRPSISPRMPAAAPPRTRTRRRSASWRHATPQLEVARTPRRSSERRECPTNSPAQEDARSPARRHPGTSQRQRISYELHLAQKMSKPRQVLNSTVAAKKRKCIRKRNKRIKNTVSTTPQMPTQKKDNQLGQYLIICSNTQDTAQVTRPPSRPHPRVLTLFPLFSISPPPLSLRH